MVKSKSGFTIVELLIVVVIIAILATVSIVAYNGIQARSKNARRANDIATIKKAIMSYDIQYGGVPATITEPRYNSATASAGRGSWDSSVDANWLAFLRADFGKMPVDPANVLPANSDCVGATGVWSYCYYCYPNSGNAYVDLVYRKEDGYNVDNIFNVSACL